MAARLQHRGETRRTVVQTAAMRGRYVPAAAASATAMAEAMVAEFAAVSTDLVELRGVAGEVLEAVEAIVAAVMVVVARLVEATAVMATAVAAAVAMAVGVRAAVLALRLRRNCRMDRSCSSS